MSIPPLQEKAWSATGPMGLLMRKFPLVNKTPSQAFMCYSVIFASFVFRFHLVYNKFPAKEIYGEEVAN